MVEVTLCNVSKSFGTEAVIDNLNLTVLSGEFVVFVGPSGCGKSTLLRLIAGLEDLTGGEILLAGETVDHVPPAQRGIAMVFQSYALYPHMTVRENIAFGMKLAKENKNTIKEKVKIAADTLELTEHLDKLPKQLSGGQRQRVAIGRAIVRDPQVFLFDEPLSNLDASLRAATRLEIAKLHDNLPDTTMIYVTHDQVEAMTLADKIVVINQGEIIQVGSPRELFNKPKNLFVAEFIGTPKMNVLNCITKRGFIYLIGKKSIKTNIRKTDDKINKIGFRPNKISICEKEKGLLNGEIKFIEYLGTEQFIYVDCGTDESLIVVKTNPDYKIPIKRIIGLKMLSKDLYFFSKNGEVLI